MENKKSFFSFFDFFPPAQIWDLLLATLPYKAVPFVLSSLHFGWNRGNFCTGLWSKSAWIRIAFGSLFPAQDLDPHYSEKLDPDPHQSENSEALEAETRAVVRRGRKKWRFVGS